MGLFYAAATLGGLGIVFGALLAWAAKVFAVEVDERVEKIQEVLPGANCGACGYAGCSNFAERVVAGECEINACIPGGKEVTDEIAACLGKEAMEAISYTAVVLCTGDNTKTKEKFIYAGAKDCNLAHRMWDGFKSCNYGCLGLGTCVDSCPFDAISMSENGLPVIDEDACTGCGMCRESCPRHLIEIIPQSYEGCLVFCKSKDRGKAVKEACEAGCIACKACVKACTHEAITFENNLPHVDIRRCDNCGDCVLKCKPGGIHPR